MTAAPPGGIVGHRFGEGVLRRWRGVSVVVIAALLSACGGESGGGTSVITPTPTPTPSTGCALRDRQNFAFSVLREWYLFPETLPASLDPAPYASVNDYIDALTATARAQRRDRFFTYQTSIAEENAFFSSGSSAGFGIRLSTDGAAGRVFVAEAFEGAPALAAGIDRGSEIIAIGTSAATLRTVSSILASEGSAGVTSALGPSTAGVTRTLRIRDAAGTRDLNVSKADYELLPVSTRYGSRIIDDGGRRVGYLNLRTFISTADPALRAAFLQFRNDGITQFVVDFRYNGGGLVSIAELMGDLLGRNRSTSEVFSFTTFRAEKSVENETRRFATAAQSVAPVRIAFIGTGSTASASELVINAFIPYLGTGMALVGTNTFGKPVGQIAIDRAACDDRIRVVAFSTRNAANSDAYFDGLASTVPVTCRAADDLTRPLGDPQEASLRQALNFVGGQSCTAIAADGQTAQSAGAGRMTLLSPTRPTPVQREVPGAF